MFLLMSMSAIPLWLGEPTGNMFFLVCIPVKQSSGDHWQSPWLVVSIRRFEVRRCAQWFGCHLKGPSCRTGLKQLAPSDNQSIQIYHMSRNLKGSWRTSTWEVLWLKTCRKPCKAISWTTESILKRQRYLMVKLWKVLLFFAAFGIV
jgi:hypothetical protein